MRLKFVQQLKNQTIKEGNSVRFDIELTHENVPVVWYRNEVKLHVSRTVLMHVEGRRHTLEMRSLSLDDTCQIKAEAKGIYSSAKLTVIGNSMLSFTGFFLIAFYFTVYQISDIKVCFECLMCKYECFLLETKFKIVRKSKIFKIL